MPVLPSYRNQSVDLHSNQLTGFYMRVRLAFNGLIQPEYSDVYFLLVVQYLLNISIQTVIFIKLDHSLLLVFVLDYHHCLYWKCLICYMKIQKYDLFLPTIHELNLKKPR